MRETVTNFGSPSVFLIRCSLSSISCVGPPPPSPKPNNTALWLALPLSLLFFTVFTSCGKREKPNGIFQGLKILFNIVMSTNSRLQFCRSLRRYFLAGSELKSLSRRDLPTKMCCALGKGRFKETSRSTHFQFVSVWVCYCTVSTHREGVDQIPAQLLCQKVGNTTSPHNLRKLCRVAESIWKPELKETERTCLEMY